jgi:hypothetical protein
VQEDFVATGTEALDKPDEYILQCDAIVHLVSDTIGAWASPHGCGRDPKLLPGPRRTFAGTGFLPRARRSRSLLQIVGSLAGAGIRMEACRQIDSNVVRNR